jgi:hypothetical protein
LKASSPPSLATHSTAYLASRQCSSINAMVHIQHKSLIYL